MSHTSTDRGGIKLETADPENQFPANYAMAPPTQWLRLRKTFKTYFDPLTHHFENTYGYQNVQKKISLMSKQNKSTHLTPI